MMDSLGGILTNGLLGNPIISRFGLFLVQIEDVTPTPTPTVTQSPTPTLAPTQTPTVTPTPTPVYLYPAAGYFLKDNKKLVKITIKYKEHEHVSLHVVRQGTFKIMINILGYVSVAKEKLIGVKVKLKDKINNIIVRKRDDRA